MNIHKGKLDLNIAKKIIADHYDVYLHKHKNPSSRTVCSHYDLDDRAFMSQSDRPKPFQPQGAVDGIVCDSTMASKMSFMGRFGNSCGMPFISKNFFNRNRQWKNFMPYVKDRLTMPWCTFSSGQYQDQYKKTHKTKTRKIQKIRNITKKQKQKQNKQKTKKTKKTKKQKTK